MPEKNFKIILQGLDKALENLATEALRAEGYSVDSPGSLSELIERGFDNIAVVVADTVGIDVPSLTRLVNRLPDQCRLVLVSDPETLGELGETLGNASIQTVLRASEPALTSTLLVKAVQHVAGDPGEPGERLYELERLTRRLQYQLERKDFEIKTLINACEKITSSLQMEDVLRFIQESARRMMNAESSSVILHDSSGEFLQIAVSTGDKEDRVKGLRFPADKGIAGWVFGHGRPLIVNQVNNDERFYPEIDQISGFHTRSIACAPMILHGRIIGVVEVLNNKEKSEFTEESLEVFTTFANLAAIALNNAMSFNSLNQDYHLLLKEQMRGDGLERSDNETMKRVYELCRHVAPLESTVLLQGDSGTGKELLADLIHRLSSRRDKLLIKVNIAALPENLVESELFGHEKGSFTGAIARYIGKFEQADRGTIFLDEIGELRPDIQVKLLRFLQEQTFERIGGAETLKVNVRIIAATNRDLRQAVNDGMFRKDLYYRLNVVPVNVPLLRDRPEDFPLLVDYFIRKFNGELNRKVTGMSPEALSLLTAYPWPGNIRELENIIERILVMKPDGTIQPEDIPSEIANSHYTHEPRQLHSSSREPRRMWDVEREMIEQTLERNLWNQSRASRELGITLNQLRYRIGKYRIDIRK